MGKRTNTAIVPSTFGSSNPFHYLFHPLPYFLRKKVALPQILHQPKLPVVTNKARTILTKLSIKSPSNTFFTTRKTWHIERKQIRMNLLKKAHTKCSHWTNC